MVSTLDFESNDPGSNPGRTFLINIFNINNILVRVAQWIERLTSNQKVAGSSPVMDIFCQVSRVWSKGCDSSSHAICFEGSNPSSDIASLAQWQCVRLVSERSWVQTPDEAYLFLFYTYYSFI